jgi:hypothetical protein
MRKLISILVLTGMALLCALAPQLVKEARACGAFFRPAAKAVPSLSTERTLIIYDAMKEREHFIREVVFRESKHPFGFVVPVPTQPEVASIESPFDRLETQFPFEQQPRGGGKPKGRAAGSGAQKAGVQVLSQQKLGSFTAFVLAATDEHGLAGWLTKQGFESSPESDTWLAYYVRLGFYYVAMRYDPPEQQSELTKAETIRISFETPLPFYPYREPARPASDQPRLLDVWLVSSERFVPVGTRAEVSQVRWVQPLAAGKTYDGDLVRNGVGVTLSDKALLPEGSLTLQRFADHKRSRRSLGDVVFVPERASRASKERRERLQLLMPLLDPLIGVPR